MLEMGVWPVLSLLSTCRELFADLLVCVPSYRASEEVKEAMFEYGKHLGLAFQIVDDVLDFTQSTEQLGKPQVGADGLAQHPWLRQWPPAG